jgi:hypothetical protein
MYHATMSKPAIILTAPESAMEREIAGVGKAQYVSGAWQRRRLVRVTYTTE